MIHDSVFGSRLEIIDGADHTLIWTHPDDLTHEIDKFLSNQPSAA